MVYLHAVLVLSILGGLLSILLLVATRYLAYYGPCTIKINQEDEKKEFTVQGGDYLLHSLTENKIHVSSSCGGKATCGYCKIKVLSGGGLILPTEEIFMSREEKLEGIRLACQVKVKNDIEIYIPDFLTTVRNIVKNRTYNPRLRWIFTIANQIYPKVRKIRIKLAFKDKMKIDGIINEFKGKEGGLISVLQNINDEYNWLPENILRYIAQELDISLTHIYSVITFYNRFSLKPRGRYIIYVCQGTSCHVRGGKELLQKFQQKLNVKVGETTPDMLFTLETIMCLGCCGLSPVVKIGEEIYGQANKINITNLLDEYRKKGVY